MPVGERTERVPADGLYTQLLTPSLRVTVPNSCHLFCCGRCFDGRANHQLCVAAVFSLEIWTRVVRKQ